MYNGQLLQDAFVDKILNIDNGYFVDIGAGTGGIKNCPINFFSNTYYLEKHRSWNGIAIDYDQDYISFASKNRNCICVEKDLTKTDINKILFDNGCKNDVDYLSLDVDNAQMYVFQALDLAKYRFKIVTIEHNLFQSFPNCTQSHSIEHKNKVIQEHKEYRSKMKSFGYHILYGNVILDNYGPVEDWYVNQELYSKYKDLELHNANCKEIINAIFRKN